MHMQVPTAAQLTAMVLTGQPTMKSTVLMVCLRYSNNWRKELQREDSKPPAALEDTAQVFVIPAHRT